MRTIIGTDPIETLWSLHFNKETSTLANGCHVRVAKRLDGVNTKYWVEDASHEHELTQEVQQFKGAHDELKHMEYAVSHDFMEPLRGISTALTAMDSVYWDGIPEGAKPLLDHAIASSRCMTRMLQDLLTYIRLDTQDRKTFKEVDLNVIMNDVTQSLRLLIDETGASITYPTLPIVKGDWRMLYQTFSNLISNAIKFRHHDRTATINISFDTTDSEYIIKIQDNGLGIPHTRLESIFDPFSRIHKQVQGSGIGLSIVKRCVEQHKGTVVANSVVNEGSVFTLTLPR